MVNCTAMVAGQPLFAKTAIVNGVNTDNSTVTVVDLQVLRVTVHKSGFCVIASIVNMTDPHLFTQMVDKCGATDAVRTPSEVDDPVSMPTFFVSRLQN